MWNSSTTLEHLDAQLGHPEYQSYFPRRTCKIPLKPAIHNPFCVSWRNGYALATEQRVGPLGTAAVCGRTEEPGEQRFCC